MPQESKITESLFIKAGEDICDKSDPDLRIVVSLSKEALAQRWKNQQGQLILAKLRGEGFSRESIESCAGRYYGQLDLRGIPLSGASLREVNFSKSDLFSADLRNADLSKADLRGCWLSESDIRGTCFDQAQMDDVLIDNTQFDERTSFAGVDVAKINFTLAALLRERAIS